MNRGACGLQSMESQRAGHDSATKTTTMKQQHGHPLFYTKPDVLALDAVKLGHQEVCRNPKSNKKKVTRCGYIVRSSVGYERKLFPFLCRFYPK